MRRFVSRLARRSRLRVRYFIRDADYAILILCSGRFVI